MCEAPPLGSSSSSPHAATTPLIATTAVASQTAPFFMALPLRELIG